MFASRERETIWWENKFKLKVGGSRAFAMLRRVMQLKRLRACKN